MLQPVLYSTCSYSTYVNLSVSSSLHFCILNKDEDFIDNRQLLVAQVKVPVSAINNQFTSNEVIIVNRDDTRMRSSDRVLAIITFCVLHFRAHSFQAITSRTLNGNKRHSLTPIFSSIKDASVTETMESCIWEDMAKFFHPGDISKDIEATRSYTQTVSLLRVGIPSLFLATSSNIAYPYVAIALANWINDSGVFAVVAQDASQYIQNILTTSGLTFSILVGQTYYFMYQQQEAIYLALFDEVTTAKSLLEQVSLVSQGRQSLYERILACVQEYVENDLTKFNDIEPAVLLSSKPMDDPLEEILYLTSVGEPSLVYQTVRSLRQARASRLGALQRKLPQVHVSTDLDLTFFSTSS